MAILEVSDVSKRFGGLTAVNKVSLDIEVGEVFSVIGPNGAGKSTLFKLISGEMAPTEGKIRYKGAPTSGLKSNVMAEKGVVRTFQETTIFRDMTVKDAIVTAHHVRGKASLAGLFFNSSNARQDFANIEVSTGEIINVLNISDVANERARNLPQGHLRTLGIGMALATKPSLLLLDEPFAGMNSVETREMADVVLRLRDGGITIVLVEHDMSAVMRVSDRIAVINFGRKIAEGHPDLIRTNKIVIDAYLGVEDEDVGI